MNIVAIDPSLTCTAIVVNDKKFIYAKQEVGMSLKTNKLKKWFELCDGEITYVWIDTITSVVHSESEVLKLLRYDSITDAMIRDIKANLDPSLDTIVGIEGYSYSSNAGPLIDLVTVSTLLRSKILKKVTTNLKVFQPAELKLLAAKLTYPAIESGVKVKKYSYKNNEGVSGGSFKKPDIYKALIENSNLKGAWIDLLNEHKDEITPLAAVPKPIEDMNDAKILYEILKNKINI